MIGFGKGIWAGEEDGDNDMIGGFTEVFDAINENYCAPMGYKLWQIWSWS